jgi:hypothetical protein
MTVRATFLFPVPSSGGWRFTPTAAQREQCIKVLQQWDVIAGEPIPHDTALRWRMGDGVDQLGVHWHGAGFVEVGETEDLRVLISPGAEIFCEACNEPIDMGEWSAAVDELFRSGTATRLRCRCDQGCSVEDATDYVGIIMARFSICLEPASGAIRNHEFLRQISDALGGIPVRSCSYHL